MCAGGKSAHFDNISGNETMLGMKNELVCGWAAGGRRFNDVRWENEKEIYNMT